MIVIDGNQVTLREKDRVETHALGSPEGFRIVAQAWLRAGWEAKYVYGFTWMGRPIIQLPEDMVRVQEIVHTVRPDVLVETGIAHGGSLVFYASLFKAMDRGRVIGIDVEIRPHNRAALEAHPLRPLITLVEGDSAARATVDQVRGMVGAFETVMVVLDSGHSRRHVLAELEAYAPLVTPGSYVVVADGIMEDLVGAARSEPDWDTNNPKAAAQEFLRSHPEFVQADPPYAFNEGNVREPVTYWKSGYLRRLP